VTVHYLTEGDKFDFRTKRVHLIRQPFQVQPITDSSNILAAYEATLLETRLTDQKSLYNLGKTRTPSGFPKSPPIFELKFYRNNSTKGYFSNNKYTVEGIVVDFS
jgi:hypothetical protein